MKYRSKDPLELPFANLCDFAVPGKCRVQTRTARPFPDSGLVMVDLAFWDDFFKQDRSWDDFGTTNSGI